MSHRFHGIIVGVAVLHLGAKLIEMLIMQGVFWLLPAGERTEKSTSVSRQCKHTTTSAIFRGSKELHTDYLTLLYLRYGRAFKVGCVGVSYTPPSEHDANNRTPLPLLMLQPYTLDSELGASVSGSQPPECP